VRRLPLGAPASEPRPSSGCLSLPRNQGKIMRKKSEKKRAKKGPAIRPGEGSRGKGKGFPSFLLSLPSPPSGQDDTSAPHHFISTRLGEGRMVVVMVMMMMMRRRTKTILLTAMPTYSCGAPSRVASPPPTCVGQQQWPKGQLPTLPCGESWVRRFRPLDNFRG
jgi:hypothetical protein